MLQNVLALILFATAVLPVAAQSRPPRIVSLAPSVTEVLFEIGAGDLLVGVTSYCQYPPQVLKLPKIGGYLTPSYEALARVSPDLAIVLPEHADIEPKLAALNIPVFRVDHRRVDGIVESLTALGDRLGVRETAAARSDAIRRLLARVTSEVAGKPRPRLLICFGRSSDFRRLYAAAPGSLHDSLLTYAGGQNVLTPGAVVYPTLSVEGVMRLDPDVIVEFAAGRQDPLALAREWRALDSLRAVKAGRVHVFTDDFLSVPGPRLVRFTETLSRALYPR